VSGAGKRVILGLGNLLFSDDGLGVHAVQALDGRVPGWELIDGGTKGVFLLPYLEGVEELLIVDAIRLGEEPGTLHVLDAHSLDWQNGTVWSGHDLALPELLQALRLQGKLPPRCLIIGLEPATLSWGTEFSRSLTDDFPNLLEAILQAAQQ
jgi:hydrogenase maturation protease